jgi:hypothetical protein
VLALSSALSSASAYWLWGPAGRSPPLGCGRGSGTSDSVTIPFSPRALNAPSSASASTCPSTGRPVSRIIPRKRYRTLSIPGLEVSGPSLVRPSIDHPVWLSLPAAPMRVTRGISRGGFIIIAAMPHLPTAVQRPLPARAVSAGGSGTRRIGSGSGPGYRRGARSSRARVPHIIKVGHHRRHVSATRRRRKHLSDGR